MKKMNGKLRLVKIDEGNYINIFAITQVNQYGDEWNVWLVGDENCHTVRPNFIDHLFDVLEEFIVL
jgi:hypothetical protein